MLFLSGEVTTKSSPTTKSIALYGFCFAHSDCGATQFCGNKCWTGRCGPDANIPMWAAGLFCQPCGECQRNSRSVTGSCDMCKRSGKESVRCTIGDPSTWFEPGTEHMCNLYFSFEALYRMIFMSLSWSIFAVFTGEVITKSVPTTKSG